ncbi:MAG: 23S rRNA (adenine(2503)-C(2))-methyltransferase RlmN [Anaerovoracaceae bacterium]
MERIMQKTNILNANPDILAGIVRSLGQKDFRARQIFGWLSKGVESFDDMSNIPAALRAKLEEKYYIGLPRVIVEQQSKTDGTRKCLFEFADGARVESVFMKYSYGNSICISSQVGCRMGCSFCASTMSGLERNLTAGEMLGQILKMRNITGEDIGHVVVMGMGEPFDNYDNLAEFIRLVNNPLGYGLGMRNITVSTCGIVPMIERFGRDFPQVNLAVSLHASNEERRKQLMPVAKAYGYDELISACRSYAEKTGRRVTFEYSMIDGVNDSVQTANELASHLKGWQTHVNLIPLNKVEGRSYNAAVNSNIMQFKKTLENAGIAVTVRRTLGADIDAACGQLRNR